MTQEALVLEMALEVGFDLAGIAPLSRPPAAEHFEAWLEAGRHADMAWLERDRERITDPRQVLPEGRSLLVVGLGHGRPAVELSDGTRVARYAAGRDYHNLVGKRLDKLRKRLVAEGLVERWRRIVDAGPLLERSHAARAGLGFESKAASLLAPGHGPWFFLGELLLDAELAPAEPRLPTGSCGTCTACLDACPTGALLAPGELDARLCISYQTIENRGAVPVTLEADHGAWVFGCDICSEVCPQGHRAPDASGAFGTHPAVEQGSALAWLAGAADQARFSEQFRGSPLQRARRDGLARNAAIVLGNRPSEQGREALARALEGDPAAVVRLAAGRALARGYAADAGVRPTLERAWGREQGARVRAALGEALAGLPASGGAATLSRDGGP